MGSTTEEKKHHKEKKHKSKHGHHHRRSSRDEGSEDAVLQRITSTRTDDEKSKRDAVLQRRLSSRDDLRRKDAAKDDIDQDNNDANRESDTSTWAENYIPGWRFLSHNVLTPLWNAHVETFDNTGRLTNKLTGTKTFPQKHEQPQEKNNSGKLDDDEIQKLIRKYK
jgi:hypothetical protein